VRKNEGDWVKLAFLLVHRRRPRSLKTRNAVVIYSREQTYAEQSPAPASLFDHQRLGTSLWNSTFSQ
jgi:hypothetical protein